MPGRRAFLRRRHVTAGASRANRRPHERTPASLLSVAFPARWNGTAAAPLPVLGPQTALRSGTACHRRPGGSCDCRHRYPAEIAPEPAALPPVPPSLSVVRLRVSVGGGSPRWRPVLRRRQLQITCHRCSKNLSAVTAKTPKNGLEITAATRATAAGWLTTLCDQRPEPEARTTLPEPKRRTRS